MNELLGSTITFLTNVRKPEVFSSIPLKEALSAVRNGKYKDLVSKARTALLIGDEDEYARIKKTLPSFCYHGTFKGRVTNDNFVASSSLLHLDIDNLVGAKLADTLEVLKLDPHTVFVYVSPSEEGLKAAFRVDPVLIRNDDDFKKAFAAISAYLEDKNIIIDPLCKDVRRISFVSYDPNLFYNKNPQVFELNTQIALEDTGLADLPDYDEITAEDSDTGICSNITLDNAAKYLPEAGEQSYSEWLKIGAILHHQFGGSDEAMAIFDTWSQSFSTYNAEEIEAKWASFKRSDGKVVTFRSLIKEYNKAHPDEKPDTGDWKAAYDKHVEKFSRNNAQVMVGGKHRIMWRLTKNSPYEFSERRQRELMYSHTNIKVGEKMVYNEPKDIFANHLAAWAMHAKTRIYMGGVVFKPGIVAGDDYYNTWQGFSVVPEENEALLKGIHKHIEDVICGGVPEMIKYFYDWTAYSFQNPDVPAMSALVLRGKKGSGKGLIGHFLSKVWGTHARYINNPKHLVGNFNALLADACFLFADEAFYSGDKKHECVLKGLITEATLVIERKGVDSYNERNHLKIMLATNEDFAVPATEDERRFCVFDVASTYIRNNKYFDPLVAEHNSKKVQAAFLYEMLNRDISGYRPGNIPESDGLREQRMHSLCSIGKWLADFLSNEEYHDEGQISACWEEQVATSELHAAYIQWCDTQKKGTYDRVGTIPFSKYMHEIYPKKQVGNKRLSGFHLGPLPEAIKKFENAKKIKLDI